MARLVVCALPTRNAHVMYSSSVLPYQHYWNVSLSDIPFMMRMPWPRPCVILSTQPFSTQRPLLLSCSSLSGEKT
eukprot:987164-Pelagomonas_calceolata.AAC.2